MSTDAKTHVHLSAIMALAEAIRALGSVPEGHLYARVMMHYRDLAAFTAHIDQLVGTKLVERRNHELIWRGP